MIKFEITFVVGPGNAGAGNDVVKIFVDGVREHTGTTWENYYRYDAEQAGNQNAIHDLQAAVRRPRRTWRSYVRTRTRATSSTR
ncbi:MAG TPA: hypothetical protein VEG38_18650 [Acidimicrobiia bacterium]|nr:hypothetical protein [Acidimicrobiia bacterium]